jgi:hypothetical protein
VFYRSSKEFCWANDGGSWQTPKLKGLGGHQEQDKQPRHCIASLLK